MSFILKFIFDPLFGQIDKPNKFDRKEKIQNKKRSLSVSKMK